MATDIQATIEEMLEVMFFFFKSVLRLYSESQHLERKNHWR